MQTGCVGVHPLLLANPESTLTRLCRVGCFKAIEPRCSVNLKGNFPLCSALGQNGSIWTQSYYLRRNPKT